MMNGVHGSEKKKENFSRALRNCGAVSSAATAGHLTFCESVRTSSAAARRTLHVI